MKDWRKALCGPDVSVRDCLRIINDAALQLAIVTGPGDVLLGVVTDGDIRRAILRGVDLAEPISAVMNRSAAVLGPDSDEDQALETMRRLHVHQLPVVDAGGRVIGMRILDDLLHAELPNEVVVMAGGLGSRLGELTRDTPKPMLPVGSKPILESIIEMLRAQGLRRIFISVNYLAEKVIDYFGDGSPWGVKIKYLVEAQPLGTFGALSLLPDGLTHPILVVNGDVLSSIDYRSLLRSHLQRRAAATMGVRMHSVQIPFGVASLDGDTLLGIEEKPVQQFFINAGVYVLEPRSLVLIPRGRRYDAPEFFRELIARGDHPAVFPIAEYWVDIGQVADFERANVEFGNRFQG